MHKVEEYKTTYKAIDKRDWHVIGCYDTIDELINKVNDYCVSHRGYRFGELFQNHNKSDAVSIKKYHYGNIDYSIPDPKPRFWHAPYSNLTPIYDNVEGIFVTDNFGDIIQDVWRLQTRKPYQSWRSKYIRRDTVLQTLYRYKNNVNKIKVTYGHHSEYSNYRDEIDYNSDVYTHNRRIRTFSNNKKLIGFVKDDGEPEPRGKQRNLPNSWDDIICGVWHKTKSWKHNSKRRKQWKDHTNANL